MKFGQWRPKFLGGPNIGAIPEPENNPNTNERKGFSGTLNGIVASIKDNLPRFERIKPSELKEPNDKTPEKNPENKTIDESTIKKIAKTTLEKIKNIDWERASISAGAGIGLKLCARTFFDVVGFWPKTGIAAAGGAVSAAAKEWYDQRKNANNLLNKEYEKIFNKEYKKVNKLNPVSKIIIKLERKKTAEGKLNIKDLKKILKRDEENLEINLNSEDVTLKKEILSLVEKLEKKDWKKIATSAAKGAFWGAAGSMVFGDLLHYAVEHDWISVPDGVKDFIKWAEKGVVSSTETVKNTAGVMAVNMGISNPEKYLNKIIEHVYEFKPETTDGLATTDGLTSAARNVIKDYLGNEKLVTNFFGKAGLSYEQKIYAEDYLRKLLEAKEFKPGTDFKIKGEWIREAVEKARGLGETSNLSQYVPKLGKAAKELMSSTIPSRLNDLRESLDTIIVNGQTVANTLVVDATH